MTISSETNRMDYTGNGLTTVYAYSFKIHDDDELLVTTRDTSDIETTLVKTTDYTVSGVGNSTGGNVTLTTALASNYHITIRRVLPLTQETDIKNQGSYYALTHEDQFDRFTMTDQQLQDQLDRAIKLSETSDPGDFDMTFPPLAGNANVVPMTNDDGDGWAPVADWPTADDIADAEENAAEAAASAASAAASAAAAGSAVGISAPYSMTNIGLAASVGSSALTVALKQADGTSDPATSAGLVRIYFRSSTLATGSITERTVTAALSVVVPSTATLGHNDALPDYIYVYAIDNAGTVELAVSSSSHWDEGTRYTTTTMSTGADDAATLYSTTSRSNVAIRLIGRLLSTQTTAGTWASAPSEVSIGPLVKKDFINFSKAAHFNLKHGAINHVSSSAARNIQLPAPRAGWWSIVKDTTGSGNAFTFVRNGSEAIDGVSASFVTVGNFGSWRVSSDGTNYFIEASPIARVSETYMQQTATYTVQTTFTTLDLTTVTDSVGTPITVSTNTITYPYIGRYRHDINCNLTSGGAREVVARIRNTSDNTTAAISASCHIEGSSALLTTFTMWLNVTDISKNYEIQFAASNTTVTMESETVDSAVSSSWKLFVRKLP